MSTTEKKAGRRPVAEKNDMAAINDFEFGNVLRLDPELIKEITDKGLVYRFVDAKQLELFGNVHKNGWVAYKRDTKSADAGTFQAGMTPDGSVRRGTLVLAVRTVEMDKKHKALLAKRNAIYSDVQGQTAQTMREMARDAGLKGDIIQEGFDEEQE